jgi:hypothetical protein
LSTRRKPSPATSLASRSASRRADRNAPLPPPLPPAERTVGQLVAESLRLYGRNFWAVLPVGLAPALIDQLLTGQPRIEWLLAMLTFGAALMTAAYVRAATIVLDVKPDRRRLLLAFAVGMVAFLPFPPLLLGFVLPGLAWLALVGLAVPVALAERTGFTASFRRAVRLAHAGFAHTLGSLATLVLVYFLSRTVLVILLRGQGDQTERVALFLGDLALSPLLFVGAALLYVDQAARLESRGRRREEA